MAYNNGFPVGYQSAPIYYPQSNVSPMMNNLPQAPQNNASNGIIWVQGEAGAKSYLVAPNNTVQLWDSESQTIYLKSADASGMPSMKVLDYKIREDNQSMVQRITENGHEYADKKYVDNLKAEIDRLSVEIAEFKSSMANNSKESKKREKSDL